MVVMTNTSPTTAIDLVAADDLTVAALRVDIPPTDLGCVIEVDNATPETLTLSGYWHRAGRFRLGLATVQPFDNGLMSASGKTDSGGVRGRATFRGRGITVSITFTNPTDGVHDAAIELSGPRTAEFRASAATSGHAPVVHCRYLVSHPVQDTWRFCGRCHGLFDDEHRPPHRHCPGGKIHVALGPRFVLLHGIPDGPHLQSGWHTCTRCSGLFLPEGDPGNHRCGAGGRHHSAAKDFAVPYGRPAVRVLTPGWRLCGDCHGLFFNGPELQNRRCATGGLHSAIGFAFGLPTRSPRRAP
jgi:hypothetical protein